MAQGLEPASATVLGIRSYVSSGRHAIIETTEVAPEIARLR